MQHNCARNTANMYTQLEIGLGRNIDFILVQELWIAQDNTYTISHTTYHTILPESCDVRPRVAIFAKKDSIYQFCYRSDLCNYYYYYSSNLRAHGVCDYDTLPVMRQDLTSYLTTYIYKYIKPYRMIFFYSVIVKLSNYLLRLRDSEC